MAQWKTTMMEMTTEIMAEMKKNKDRNGNDNAAPGSGSDGTIFDLILLHDTKAS